MVAKRQCSFCAQEIEPGTGTIFVKRDGTVYQFCSSSCRKQQLHLGRIGHRFKWTRAYELKRATERSAAERVSATPGPAPRASATRSGGPKEAPVPHAADTAAPEAVPAPAGVAGSSGPAPAKKPRAKSAAKSTSKSGPKADASSAPKAGAAPPSDDDA